MNEAQFMKDRVEDQLGWYRKKSARNKNYYLILNTTMIITGSLIPLVAGFANYFNDTDGFIVACLGALTGLAGGISALFKFQDKWTTYRITAEALLREKVLYQTRSRSYAGQSDAFRLFVSNVEDILGNENKGWNQLISEQGNSGEAEGQ